jgi:hypothetical protein
VPTSVPLPAIAERLVADPWRNLDARCALGVPHAMAWVRGAAMVCAWGPPPIIHALNPIAFDDTARLLADLREELPARFELRGGPAVAGVIAERHQLQLLGPVVRLRSAGGTSEDPAGLVPLGVQDLPEIVALADREATVLPQWLALGDWVGVRRGHGLVAAVGPRDRGPRVTVLAPPVVSRQGRRLDIATPLLAAAARRLDGDVGLDLRIDRRERLAWVKAAGFEQELVWERWWATPWR